MKHYEMKVLRWILFFPVGFIILAMGQLLASALAVNLHGFLLAIVLLAFGIAWTMAGAFSVMICPKRRIGGSVLIGLFVVLEIAALAINTPNLAGKNLDRLQRDYGHADSDDYGRYRAESLMPGLPVMGMERHDVVQGANFLDLWGDRVIG